MLGALNDYKCGGGYALNMWIHDTNVMKALHVADGANYFSGDNGAGFTYNVTEPSV